MKYYSLDQIVRNALLTQGKSIHWYVTFLNYGAMWLRERNRHFGPGIKSVKLPVDPTLKTVSLPDDYVQYARVSIPVGQRMRNLISDDKLTHTINTDESGNRIPHVDVEGTWYLPYTNYEMLWLGGNSAYTGQFLGRLYGYPPGGTKDYFTVVESRREIQLDVSITAEFVILEYYGDGMDDGAFSMVDPNAEPVLLAWIEWKSRSSATWSDGQRAVAERAYWEAFRIYRAQTDPLTPDEVRRIHRSGIRGTYKY